MAHIGYHDIISRRPLHKNIHFFFREREKNTLSRLLIVASKHKATVIEIVTSINFDA
jgi:hypothetical protein